MNDLTGNPYQAPDSRLTVDGDDSRILQFKRFSAWGVFGLSIITLGIYPIYWLYSRTMTANTLHEDKIPQILLYGMLIGLVINLASNFAGDNELLIMGGAIFSLLYMVCYLMVLFKLRNRLRDFMNGAGGNQYVLNGILTFFFSSIYLQYKINECLDQRSNEPV